MKRSIIISCFSFFIFCEGYSNNVQVSNITLTGQDMASDYTLVQFDISWDNSWRTSTLESNWDACWVFVKHRLQGALTWNHSVLNYVDGTAAGDGHTQPAGSTITGSSDGKGALMYRSEDGAQGSVNYTNVKLRWNYGTNGVGDYDNVEVCVLAIEMVFVPQGSFYLGDGTVTNIRGQFESGTSGARFLLNSEALLTLGGGGAGSLGNNDTTGMTGTKDDFWDATSKTLPAAFPKGYNAFYCMKYEITQGQYTDFLNKLTRTQQNTRTATDVSTDAITNIYVMSNTAALAYRSTIVCPATGNGTVDPVIFSTTSPFRACNFMSWGDGAAYADWAGLRPMTEMEFEKACRGTEAAVVNENAWGTATATGATGISNDGTSTETSSNGAANCVYLGPAVVSGPLRSGWAAGGSRTNAGASYYGIMELSGNVWERCVSVGISTGRNFTGVHGDGILDANGDANTAAWPGTSGTGACFRGGAWTDSAKEIRVSDRYNASLNSGSRGFVRGWRAAKTAP